MITYGFILVFQQIFSCSKYKYEPNCENPEIPGNLSAPYPSCCGTPTGNCRQMNERRLLVRIPPNSKVDKLGKSE